ncbi:class I SAM-dependent methyltransferase [uncultured Enterococcus sp.]|uniref:class I SAM-dependent methyltransferase n=1 Tax=uncultured Enterococcus sp. TaxID=167972 RepID=UPI002AA6E540|nr:class I SAM-dependent methyltransferase [uncultured Enterococcus sp.]
MVYVVLSIAVLAGLFFYLLKQSKEPTGIVGVYMMRLWNRVYLPMVDWSLTYIPRTGNKRILDVGVGNGRSTQRLAAVFPDSEIYGIDVSQKAIEQAKKLYEGSMIAFEVKDVIKTSYPSAYFELICVYQNHFHWSDLEKGLNELNRILASEGIIVIACEISKVKYYLPDFIAVEKFQAYLNTLGLKLIDIEQNSGWIFYKIEHANNDVYV